MLKEIQNAGFTVGEYLKVVRNYRSLMRSLYDQARPDGDHVDRLRDASMSRGITAVTLMTEDWCGDSACGVPILARLCAAAEIPFVIVRGSELPELKELYEADGDDHIPAVSLWGGRATGSAPDVGHARELARWIEAPAAVQHRKDAWKAERPEFADLYRRKNEGDAEAARAFGPLYREFLETMAAWYRDEGLWRETTREIVDLAEGVRVES